MIDPRGVTTFQDSYDADGRVTQQALALGPVVSPTFTLANPTAPTSPVISTTVTDALGNPTTYRFNMQGFVTDVTDALGQTKSFIRDPGTNQILKFTGSAQRDICGPPGMGPVSYTYDAQGNTLTSTDALGNTTTYTYEPVFKQVTSITDPHRSCSARFRPKRCGTEQPRKVVLDGADGMSAGNPGPNQSIDVFHRLDLRLDDCHRLSRYRDQSDPVLDENRYKTVLLGRVTMRSPCASQKVV
ncbi:MAG TPA: hypothetical protein VGG72_12315 [Bryobacteraceae bacterium]|jgi:YD repeat-containing protein